MPETVLERVAVGAGVLDRLRGHAADCSPEEACALLLGTTDGPTCVITDAILTENTDHSPVRFAVPDDQLIRSYRAARGTPAGGGGDIPLAPWLAGGALRDRHHIHEAEPGGPG